MVIKLAFHKDYDLKVHFGYNISCGPKQLNVRSDILILKNVSRGF